MLSPSTLSYLHNAYDRMDSSLEEFDEDVGRIYSMMRLFRKYRKHGFTNARAVVNNLVILHNVFGHTATSLALHSEIEEKNRVLLNTSLFVVGRDEGKEIDLEFKSFLEKSLIGE